MLFECLTLSRADKRLCLTTSVYVMQEMEAILQLLVPRAIWFVLANYSLCGWMKQ